MKSTYEMFMDAGLFEQDVEACVRLAMYYLQTERFDRAISPARNEHGIAMYQTGDQADRGNSYALALWKTLKLDRMHVKDQRDFGDLSFVGLTHFLMAHRDIVEDIENECEL